jgi:hypothetical protein
MKGTFIHLRFMKVPFIDLGRGCHTQKRGSGRTAAPQAG